jgi:hypothetical protein
LKCPVTNMELVADEETQRSLIEKEEPAMALISNPGQAERVPGSNLNGKETMTSGTRAEDRN